MTSSLHRVAPILGFVTDDMFARYEKVYKREFEHDFKNAREVDEYFQKERFPKPR